MTWVSGDALIAGAEDRVSPVEAIHRGASRSRIALIAIVVADVAEVSAAGPLQDVAAERRHVPQLRAGGELEAIRNHWIVALDVRISRYIGHPCQRTQFQIFAVEANGGPNIRKW